MFKQQKEPKILGGYIESTVEIQRAAPTNEVTVCKLSVQHIADYIFIHI